MTSAMHLNRLAASGLQIKWRIVMTSIIITLRKIQQNLEVFMPKMRFLSNFNAMWWIESNIRAPYYWIYKTHWETRLMHSKNMSTCVRSSMYSFFPEITISGTLHVDKDSVMTLICNATGTINPPDHIDWFKDGQKITADKKKGIELHKRFSIHSRTITSTLRKVKADMGDTGTYVCRTSSMQVTSVKVNVLNSK